MPFRRRQGVNFFFWGGAKNSEELPHQANWAACYDLLLPQAGRVAYLMPAKDTQEYTGLH